MRPALIMLTMLLSGCTQGPAVVPGGTQAVRCIHLDQVAGRSVAGADRVRFTMAGPTDYLNTLQGQCPGLARLGDTATVSVASGGEGGRLCRGDRIRIFDPVEARATGLASSPTCILGDFLPQRRR